MRIDIVCKWDLSLTMAFSGSSVILLCRESNYLWMACFKRLTLCEAVKDFALWTEQRISFIWKKR